MLKRVAEYWSRPAGLHLRSLQPAGDQPLSGRLRCLSFNMQAGLGHCEPQHYATRSWRHLLPPRDAHRQLHRIAHLLQNYDLIALQEVDGGSLRSNFTNQVEMLATIAGLGWWHQQLNRDLGLFGQFGNGLLCRSRPLSVHDHALPGLKGRGATVACFGLADGQQLAVVNVHLALGREGRGRQLAYLAALVQDYPLALIMGDLNCSQQELAQSPLGQRRWHWQDDHLPTFPSWHPQRQLDHVLVSPPIEVLRAASLDARLSDHCPLSVELRLPEA